jgi:hypothetical protein
MILGFHTKQLTERGTEVATLDYAAGAQSVLGHEARIFVPQSDRVVDAVRHRVAARFELVVYERPEEIVCDALYVIKRGLPGRVTASVPELNHAFFDASYPHGHRFATVSDWVSRLAVRHIRLPRGRTLDLPRLRKPPVVPHIVALPDFESDLRDELGIPGDAVVFGRHGGFDTFRIAFVHDAIRAALAERDDLWFVFLNTEAFQEHPRIAYLPMTLDRGEIRRFVNTCDYMIHAHWLGETFGLAVAEFAYAGVPVLTYLLSPRLAQLDLLSDELLLGYTSYEDVHADFLTLPRRTQPVPSDVRERFGVKRIMARFDDVFLQ